MNIRTADPSEFQKVVDFLRMVFSGNQTGGSQGVDREVFDWRYAQNPLGAGLPIIAEDHDTIIGFYPNMPLRIKINGATHLGGMVLNLATHPDYRRQGVFTRMGETARHMLKENRFALSIAYPNQRSFPGFIKKLNFRLISRVPVLIRPISGKGMAERFKNTILQKIASLILTSLIWIFWSMPPSKKKGVLQLEWKTTFDADVDTLWEKSKRRGEIALERTFQFLDWRFHKRPKVDYRVLTARKEGKLIGYAVIREVKLFGIKAGALMDFLCAPEESESRGMILNEVLAEFKRRNCGLSVAIALPKTDLFQGLKQCGFLKIPERLNVRPFNLVGRIEDSQIEESHFFNPDEWYVTLADWDVY